MTTRKMNIFQKFFQWRGLFWVTFVVFFFLLIPTVFSPIFALDIRDIREGGAPIVTEKGVVFHYKADGKLPSDVAVSGDFNNWVRPLKMFRNRFNVFVYQYEEIGLRGIVLKPGTYRYRFLIDGNWKIDPLNPLVTHDKYGTKLSFFTVRKPIIVVKSNPIALGKNNYIFYYRNENAKRVSLVGDFNFWNPYSLPMKKNIAGLWEVEVNILPGSYAYRFLVDGHFRTDPFGTMLVVDRFRNELSYVELPKK